MTERIGTPDEFEAQREQLLAEEKEHTRRADELAVKRRGWSIPWASSANSDFNFDFGASFHEEEMRAAMPPEDQLPPIASHNADASGTDLVGYISEMFGATVFALQGDTVYKTYATGGRGVEFLMPYYWILDRTPRGRDEGGAFQTWIRRHDEYAEEGR
jgi:predicted dithiol-disulfide oxidoreductase (DUF899 family)